MFAQLEFLSLVVFLHLLSGIMMVISDNLSLERARLTLVGDEMQIHVSDSKQAAATAGENRRILHPKKF